VEKIRKSPARAGNFDSAVLNLPQGAHLRIKSYKLFPPKFNDEDGDLWVPRIKGRLEVVDDRTEEGAADGLEFDDSFELKIDPGLGFEPEDIKDGNIRDFDEEEQALLLDEDNWTIGGNTKADNLNIALYGQDWGTRIDFHPETHWLGKEFIAKVKPRTGKRAGSYCSWDSFVSLEAPKKKRKRSSKGKSTVQQAQEESQQVALSPEDEQLMEETLPG
jgi:hypothetical protein